jgi:tRNA threonylcarbamoyladenosine biosynthesis protein TsaE
VEWPDRLGDLAPSDAISLTLSQESEGRRAVLTGGRLGLLQGLEAAWAKNE